MEAAGRWTHCLSRITTRTFSFELYSYGSYNLNDIINEEVLRGGMEKQPVIIYIEDESDI